MEEIIASSAPAHVTALLTRAEEAGFIGALSASVHESLPTDGLIVAIEASKAHASARLGEGVIVRVGDRARMFDPSLTAHVAAIAQKLAARDKAFRFSRQLMSGGTCESTAYAMFGYRATGLCLALGNYHNQGQVDKVAPEQIDARDFECLVKLLAALPADDSSPEKTDQALMDRLQGLIKERQRYL
jgi:endoglucanase